MLFGIAEAYGRRQDRIELTSDFAPDGIGEDRIGAKGQMPAVVLDRAEGHDGGRDTGIEEPAQRRGSEFLQEIHDQAFSARLKLDRFLAALDEAWLLAALGVLACVGFRRTEAFVALGQVTVAATSRGKQAADARSVPIRPAAVRAPAHREARTADRTAGL